MKSVRHIEKSAHLHDTWQHYQYILKLEKNPMFDKPNAHLNSIFQFFLYGKILNQRMIGNDMVYTFKKWKYKRQVFCHASLLI